MNALDELMTRPLLKIGLLLLLGVIINVAVAGACVWQSWPPSGELIDESKNLRLDVGRGGPAGAFDAEWIARFGWQPRSPTVGFDFGVTKYDKRSLGYCRTDYTEQASSLVISTARCPDDVAIVAVTQAGLPLSSFVAERWSDYTQPSIATPFVLSRELLSWPPAASSSRRGIRSGSRSSVLGQHIYRQAGLSAAPRLAGFCDQHAFLRRDPVVALCRAVSAAAFAACEARLVPGVRVSGWKGVDLQ